VKENNQNQNRPTKNENVPAHVVAWQCSAELYFLPVDALGKLFKFGGQYYRVMGINVTKRSTPVITVNDHTGVRRNFSAKTIRRIFQVDEWGLPIRKNR